MLRKKQKNHKRSESESKLKEIRVNSPTLPILSKFANEKNKNIFSLKNDLLLNKSIMNFEESNINFKLNTSGFDNISMISHRIKNLKESNINNFSIEASFLTNINPSLEETNCDLLRKKIRSLLENETKIKNLLLNLRKENNLLKIEINEIKKANEFKKTFDEIKVNAKIIETCDKEIQVENLSIEKTINTSQKKTIKKLNKT